MFGDRFNRSEHQKLRYLCEAAMKFQRAGDTTGAAIFQRWFLKYFGDIFGYKSIIDGSSRIAYFVMVTYLFFKLNILPTRQTIVKLS